MSVAERGRRAAHGLALRLRRAPVLALDFGQDQRLRLREPVGLGKVADHGRLFLAEDGAGPAQRREPLHRVF